MIKKSNPEWAEKGYGNHSCNDCGNKSCPISNYLSTPNTCSYYDPPIAHSGVYPDWYIKELDEMARTGVVCSIVGEK